MDLAGAAYIAGSTGSFDFPVVNALQPTFLGDLTDAFVCELAPDGSALLYSTYLGSTEIDEATDIAVDSLGAAYVIGFTTSPDFPSVNPLPLPAPEGSADAFVSKLAPDGTRLIYSTRLGGKDDDFGMGIAIDVSGAAYVTGFTFSRDFPTMNALQPRLDGFSDAFVVKIAPEGGAMIYGTYLGGFQDDWAYDIAVDTAGAAHVTGFTGSGRFPTKNPLQPASGGSTDVFVDVFVSKFSPNGAALVYSTLPGWHGKMTAVGALPWISRAPPTSPGRRNPAISPRRMRCNRDWRARAPAAIATHSSSKITDDSLASPPAAASSPARRQPRASAAGAPGWRRHDGCAFPGIARAIGIRRCAASTQIGPGQ